MLYRYGSSEKLIKLIFPQDATKLSSYYKALGFLFLCEFIDERADGESPNTSAVHHSTMLAYSPLREAILGNRSIEDTLNTSVYGPGLGGGRDSRGSSADGAESPINYEHGSSGGSASSSVPPSLDASFVVSQTLEEVVNQPLGAWNHKALVKAIIDQRMLERLRDDYCLTQRSTLKHCIVLCYLYYQVAHYRYRENAQLPSENFSQYEDKTREILITIYRLDRLLHGLFQMLADAASDYGDQAAPKFYIDNIYSTQSSNSYWHITKRTQDYYANVIYTNPGFGDVIKFGVDLVNKFFNKFYSEAKMSSTSNKLLKARVELAIEQSDATGTTRSSRSSINEAPAYAGVFLNIFELKVTKGGFARADKYKLDFNQNSFAQYLSSNGYITRLNNSIGTLVSALTPTAQVPSSTQPIVSDIGDIRVPLIKCLLYQMLRSLTHADGFLANTKLSYMRALILAIGINKMLQAHQRTQIRSYLDEIYAANKFLNGDFTGGYQISNAHQLLVYLQSAGSSDLSFDSLHKLANLKDRFLRASSADIPHVRRVDGKGGLQKFLDNGIYKNVQCSGSDYLTFIRHLSQASEATYDWTGLNDYLITSKADNEISTNNTLICTLFSARHVDRSLQDIIGISS